MWMIAPQKWAKSGGRVGIIYRINVGRRENPMLGLSEIAPTVLMHWMDGSGLAKVGEEWVAYYSVTPARVSEIPAARRTAHTDARLLQMGYLP